MEADTDGGKHMDGEKDMDGEKGRLANNVYKQHQTASMLHQLSKTSIEQIVHDLLVSVYFSICIPK